MKKTRVVIGDLEIAPDSGGGWVLNRLKVAESGKNKGQPYPVAIGYYGRLEHLLRRIVDLRLQESGAETLGELRKALETVHREIREAYASPEVTDG